MKILVTGVTGRLGEAFLRLLPELGHEVVGLTRDQLDLMDVAGIDGALLDAEYDILINPAGMTGLEQCLDAPEAAMQVNAYAPEQMAYICAEKGAKFVHFSTDYVFDGESVEPLTEESETNPISDYGKSKAEGEELVLDACGDALVCRVSWIFGPGKKSVFDGVLEQALRGEQGAYIADKWSVPSYADDIVAWTMHLLEAQESGIYHLCSDDDPVSWWDYACGVLAGAQAAGVIDSYTTPEKQSLASMAAFRAKRPVHTAMSCEKLKETGASTRSWAEAAVDFIRAKA